jgi:triosephosphate isomerase
MLTLALLLLVACCWQRFGDGLGAVGHASRRTLVGHSERRQIVGESNALSGEKAVLALQAGVSVVFCVGETLEEREAGKVLC